MFDMVRPCKSCPFRKGLGSKFRLHPGRLAEIRAAPAFQCHGTIDYDTEEGEGRTGDRPQQCAGLMAVLHREKRENQIMQVASRIGALDLGELDPAGQAYASWADVLSAHSGTEPEGNP